MKTRFVFSFFSIAIALCLAYSTAQAQAWIARHGLNPAQYQSEYNTNKQNGYRLTNVNGYTHNGQERYTAIWEQITGPAFATHHGISGAQYQDKVTEYKNQGYRLTHVSGYGVGNAAKFAAIWEKKAGGAWAAKHNLTAAQYQAEFNNFKNQGFRLVHVCGYVVNNVEYFAAIWEKKAGGAQVAKHNLTAAQFQNEFNTLGGQGYVLVNLSGYTKNNTPYYTGIWEQTSSQPRYVRHGITAENYQHVHDNMYYQGYRPLFVQGFASGNSSRFNGIWINKNFTGADLAKINNAVNSFMQSQNVPGLSLAIMKDGRLVFAKGYGNARTNVEMSPNHPLRIFSISKSLTAVAIIRLVQQGNPTLLDRKVFGPNSVLGAKYPTSSSLAGMGNFAVQHPLHQFTVRQLLNMTSGLRTGNGEPPFWNANSTVKQCMDDLMGRADLVTTAPNQGYIYSNINYYFLARVIEEVSGQPYETYVRNHVLNPSGIGNTMYVGLANGQSKAGEATYTPQSSPNMQQFGGFGGWVARPIDLLKFLRRVDGIPNPNDIITNTNHNIMTTTSAHSSAYALGWRVDGGQQYHGGAFGGSRSWLVKMPSNGLSYAIITNSDSADAWALKSLMDTTLPTVSNFPSYDLF